MLSDVVNIGKEAPVKNDGTYDARQVSGQTPDHKHMLSTLVKRTYNITDKGDCILSGNQVPLTEEFEYYDPGTKLLAKDLDLYPMKLHTDVVIKGKARSLKKTNQFTSGVHFGNYNIQLRIIGDRKAFFKNDGKISFTDPGVIEEVPLRYDFAYGGKDAEAEKKIELPPPELIKNFPEDADLLESSLYRYQRNPLGKGYIVEFNNSSAELELPNLEDPEYLLTAENIVVKDPALWYKMPLPRCTDWVSPTWFPRIAYFGIFNLPGNLNYTIPELANNWVEPNILSLIPMQGKFSFRCTNGASLGLQLSYVKPGKEIRLVNIHPKFSDFIIKLPAEYPDIWVDGRKGRLLETKPVIHSIIIEPDENRLSIVWRGSGPALRPYFEEELKTMPYKVEWNKK